MIQLTSEQFLEQVWPTTLLTNETYELRVINRKTKAVARKFVRSISEFLEMAKKFPGCDIYFGVSTRFGHGGKKHDCYRSKALWADLDGKSLGDVKDFPITPNIVVDSGGGLHVYIVADDGPILIREHVNELEEMNAGLAQQLGGDEGCSDVTRILRVPGFLNHKYNPPRKVRAYAVRQGQTTGS